MKAQLTLRDLFWLVLVVGMACAWWVDRRQSAKALQGMTEEADRRSYQLAIERRFRRPLDAGSLP